MRESRDNDDTCTEKRLRTNSTYLVVFFNGEKPIYPVLFIHPKSLQPDGLRVGKPPCVAEHR